jgi:hypothetical protein
MSAISFLFASFAICTISYIGYKIENIMLKVKPEIARDVSNTVTAFCGFIYFLVMMSVLWKY